MGSGRCWLGRRYWLGRGFGCRGLFFGVLFGCMLLGSSYRAEAQAQEIQQLLLDIEKLTQFKAILSDMEQGYTLLSQGYGQVKDLTQGNFNLHSLFLNGLLAVNPEVAKYGRVADIVLAEANLVSEYQKAYSRFSGSGRFSVTELDYLARVYGQLSSAALQNLEELSNILTATKLRMSDDERLSAVDRIYTRSNDQLVFMRSFNRRVNLLSVQRQKAADEVRNLKGLFP